MVGMSGGYFPYLCEARRAAGSRVDFINALAKETGDEVNFVTMSFSGRSARLESNRIDTIANQIHHHPRARGEIRLFAAFTSLTGRRSWVRPATKTPSAALKPEREKPVAVNLGSNFESC